MSVGFLINSHYINWDIFYFLTNIFCVVSHFAFLQDHEPKRVLPLEHHLFWVRDLYADALSQLHQRLLRQALEEGQSLEDLLVGLLQELTLQVHWQTADELPVRLEAELLLDLVGLADVVVDLRQQVLADLVLLGQPAGSLQVLLFRLVLLGDVGEQRADFVDDVGQDDAAHALDHRDQDGLVVVGRRGVAEAQHGRHGPEVGVGVLLVPGLLGDAHGVHPVLLASGNADEHDADEVGEEEVDQEHLDDSPVLLSLEVGDEDVFEFGHFAEELASLEEEDKA